MPAQHGEGLVPRWVWRIPYRQKCIPQNLTARNTLLMLKGALPPTIVIAIYQSSAIADITLTVGYLSALISVLSQALMPRAKFVKIILFDLLATCVSASLCCLTVFCAVKAREHTTAPNEVEGDEYNSSACAVAAIWLIVLIWIANAVRAWKPAELQDPMVAFSVFASVTVTRAGMFGTLGEGLGFVSRLLKGFMIGFAIAGGVSLVVYPVTSRGDVFRDVQRYVSGIAGVLRAQVEFVEGSEEVVGGRGGLLERTRTARSLRGEAGTGEADVEERKRKLQAAITGLNALHGKLQADLSYAKNEVAWGKLSADDLSRIGGLLRNILLPLSGMTMLPNILDMIVTNNDDFSDFGDGSEKRLETRQLLDILKRQLIGCADLVNTGLQYSLLKLEILKPKHLKRRPGQGDEETGNGNLDPTRPDFTSLFDQRVQEYSLQRKNVPKALASLATMESERTDIPISDDQTVAADADVRQELFLILFMSQLEESLLKAATDFISFADGKVADGTMQRSRIIFPRISIIEWLSLSKKGDNEGPATSSQDTETRKYPDPEHLPPSNAWEKASTVLRHISHLIKSEESVFGFRVAAASFCVGILAYLHQTQDFFVRQRCIWAMIVIVIGMSPTSGQTMLGFVTRIAATVVSLALSLMVWYIPDQKTAGVIVFLYLANVFEYYFYITKPQLFGPSVIAIVTLNVIVGYELQIRKLGLEAGTSNGQPYYPIYLFGPYKLAAVAAGCAISFFWVIFPYPVSSKSTLRTAIGRSLFILAKFYSCMHTTIELWMNGELGNIQDSRSASRRLERARHAIFREEMVLLNSLRTLSHFSRFEPPVGGRFPKAAYDNIIAEIQRVLVSMALMARTAQSLETPSAATLVDEVDAHEYEHEHELRWSTRLATIALESTAFKSHSITSLLCHLGSSITNAQPLPPYLSAGDSFPLARRLREVDGGLLSIRHIEDPAFSAFVAMEVLRSVVGYGLGELLSNVRDLVGEISFDFHVRDGRNSVEERRLMDDVEEE
ncbi:MFS transporter [Aspergillus heterothallicus]